MADLVSFKITPMPVASITNVPRLRIECQLVEEDGTLLANFMGANAIVFPDVFSTLTNAQRHALIQQIATFLIGVKANRISIK